MTTTDADTAAPTGQRVGYVRVSTAEQHTDRQLADAVLDRTFTDKASGKDTNRPALTEALGYLRDGDTLVVHSMDRLARSLEDLRRTVRELAARGVAVQFTKEAMTFTGQDSPMNTLMLSMLGAVAEFERAMILERQREGIVLAKARGAYKGRAAALTAAEVDEVRASHAAGESATDIAQALGVARSTVYRALQDGYRPRTA